MSKTTKNILRIILTVTLVILALFGVIFIALIVYYYPVLDRLFNLCSYYPHAFIDCQ